MWNSFRKHACRLALVVTLTLCCAGRASANAITLSNVQVQVDPIDLIASVSAVLEAQVDTGTEVFLEGLSVSFAQNGVTLDLTAGPVTLDDTPFFVNTPVTMVHGQTTGPLLLFQLLGLTHGSLYTGSFYLVEGGNPLQVPPQTFSFTMSQVPSSSVPEPGTLLLLSSGAGLAALWRRRRTA